MTTRKTKRVCVYRGSGSGADPAYAETAERLGKALAASGIGLVYGGGGNGLMGTLAKTVKEHGGHVTGVIPGSLEEREHALKDIDERHVVGTFHERKMLMFTLSDGFIALPGGLGTLEELVEQLTWTQLHIHSKPVVIVNTNGYWDLLLTMFDKMRAERFIHVNLDPLYTVVESPEQAVALFRKKRTARKPEAPGLIGA